MSSVVADEDSSEMKSIYNKILTREERSAATVDELYEACKEACVARLYARKADFTLEEVEKYKAILVRPAGSRLEEEDEG
jgi:hypothetical protein